MWSSLRSLLLVPLALLLVSSTATADVPISEEARTHFHQGVEYLKDRRGPRYREAYQAFQLAYEISPSPKILGNLGLCAMKLERDTEAIDAYERYLNEAGAVSPREHRQIIEDLVKLRGRDTTLRLTVRPAGATVTDERLRPDGPPVVNDYQVPYGKLDIRVHLGQHRLTVKHDGYEPVVWEFEAHKRLVPQRTVELKPQVEEPEDSLSPGPEDTGAPRTDQTGEPDDELLPTAVWIGIAATGALAVTTAVVGSMALSNKASFDEELDAGHLDQARSLRDDGLTLNVVTDVALGTTIAAAATTVLLYFVLGEDGDAPQGDDGVEDTEPNEPTASWTLRPWALSSGAGLGATAAF